MTEKEQITRLEERYAHLQKHMGQQDKAMLELADEVKKLRKELAILRAAQPGGSEPGEMTDERPPHY